MYLKIHHTPREGDIVAVCDQELINTTLEWNGLSVPISESFYGTTRATEEEVCAAMRSAMCINLMGRRAFACARKLDLVDANGCLLIGDVPHAQIFRI
ncbi:MAG: DUF424 domain-containing protein [Methanomicrobiales archaeon]|nr:DUF424 domain-containing protein [Methanomicrobiales archaeon]